MREIELQTYILLLTTVTISPNRHEKLRNYWIHCYFRLKICLLQPLEFFPASQPDFISASQKLGFIAKSFCTQPFQLWLPLRR